MPTDVNDARGQTAAQRRTADLSEVQKAVDDDTPLAGQEPVREGIRRSARAEAVPASGQKPKLATDDEGPSPDAVGPNRTTDNLA